jgi:hypothetical protein
MQKGVKMVKKTKKKPMKKQVKRQDCGKMGCNDPGGCIYFLGFIGTVIYYVSTATGFWGGVLGIIKALVWPVFIVMKILGL